jgi:CRP-like cAMP-binding protein
MLAEISTGTDRSIIEDPLSYLPVSAITEYRKGQVIYDLDRPTNHLYLVIEGCVKVNRVAGNSEIVMNLCQVDDFFGETAFVQEAGERAVALETSKVMSWPVEAVREMVLRHPRLGIAFIQLFAKRCFDLGERISTLSTESTARRLARALLDLSDRLGHPETRDTRRLAPFSHKLLAQYIGTTREAVTHCMNQFRREGFVTYSRRDMLIYSDSLRRWVGANGAQAKSMPLPAEVVESPRNGSHTD